jgi:subtilase family serine protease
MKVHIRAWTPVLVGTSLLTFGLGVPSLATASSGHGSAVLRGTAPFASKGIAARRSAPANETTVVHLFLGRNQGLLQARAKAVSDPRSASYRHFMTAAQVNAEFEATPAQVARVASWLRSQGLHLTSRSAYLVSAAGPASAVAQAFDTRVVPSTPGQVTNATAMRMPSSLGGSVVTATVQSTRPVAERPKYKADLAKGRASDCSSFYGQKAATGVPPAYGEKLTWAPCGYTAPQLQSALYAKGSGLVGTGATVAVLSGDNDSTAFADANVQAKAQHFPLLKKSQFVAYVEPNSADGVGDVESALDVESIHAMAPGATIAYVAGGDGASQDPTLNALEQVVQYHLADVVTDSWGLAEKFTPAIERAFTNALQRAGMEGITVNSASGDVGSDPSISYLFPASDPWLTTVGGTSVAISSTSQTAWQTGWEGATAGENSAGDGWTPTPPGTFWGGSTGGLSTLFREPWYQRHIASHNVVKGKRMEVYPDVSDLADPFTGYSIAFTESQGGDTVFATYGGTSMASPLLAGVEADIIQARHGSALGYLNPTLYGLYGSEAFKDVTDQPQGAGVTEAVVLTGRKGAVLGTLGQAQLTNLVCGPGFDDVSGLGSPSPRFFTLLRRD